MRFKVHGIEFIRTGKCNQCGGCADKCIECPHGVAIDSGAKCTIYQKREKHCEICSEIYNKPSTHQICIDFPNHPWLHVIRRGVCGYKFKRVDGKSMDKTIFMDGKYLI